MASSSTENSAIQSSSTLSSTTTNDRNHQLALHHATLLQQRKDTEATVLNALEELIDFPTDPQSTSKRPTASDVQRFARLISPFQVSDYDSLLEERNCAGKCAYVFCSNVLKRTAPPGGYSRILRGNRRWGSTKDQDLQIVPSAKFEMWCDKWCARAALYIKLQLSEVPAWERAAGSTTDIAVLSDLTYGELASEMTRMGTARRNDEEVREMMEELALERGERSERANIPISIPLRERTTVESARPPVRFAWDGQAGEIEGYAPRHRAAPLVHADRKIAEEDEDRDWNLG